VLIHLQTLVVHPQVNNSDKKNVQHTIATTINNDKDNDKTERFMSMNDRDYEEKRNFIRMTMNATAKLTVNGNKAIEVTCIDLSAGGMTIQSTEAIAPGTSIQVNIESPNAQFRSMNAKGEVLRCETAESGRYDLGIQLDSIS
jgi:hypothetical protein